AAGPYELTIVEASGGTGFGLVGCEYKEGGATLVEEPCPEIFETKKTLKLLPVPEEGSEFVGFEGGIGSAAVCNVKPKCTFTIEADSTLEARFDEIIPTLAIKDVGAGLGEVLCAEELNPPEGCEASAPFGTKITLVPEAAEGSEFVRFENG